MSPATADISEHFKRLLGTPGGKSLIEDLERQAAERDALIERRRAAAAKIAEARRRKREDLPKLNDVEEKALAVAQEAKRRHETAHEAYVTARQAAHALIFLCHDDVRIGEAELRSTSDPRLVAAADTAHTASANWHHWARRAAITETRGILFYAHSVTVNREELDAVKQRVEAVERAIDLLRLTPEPGEDEIVAVVKEAEEASRPIVGVLSRILS